ncbi:GntR family transcriptional regulator [Amycolatopsis sacchari]|uniref:GntR family transcriptional regulator n=1 Tax=Amycolatopsis sacchari TaxID=115433 RepID=UPI003EB94324
MARHKISTVDLVLHEIRQSILTGSLAPGKAFTVSALAAQLGVSHVPVREALRQLDAQGLVILNPSRSATVAPLDPAEVSAIYRLRLRLEPDLAAESAPYHSEDDIVGLRRLVDETFHSPPGEHRWGTHRAFHATLIQPAASAWDLRVLNVLWDAAERYTRMVFDSIDATEEIDEARERAHLRLIDAAVSRDPAAVRDELHRHLSDNLTETLHGLDHIAGQQRR